MRVQVTACFLMQAGQFYIRDASIDFINKSSAQGQLMDVADTAVRDSLMRPVNIVTNIAAGHHRSRLVLPISFLYSFRDFSLGLANFLAIFFFTRNAPCCVSFFVCQNV